METATMLQRKPGINTHLIEKGVAFVLEGLGVNTADENFLETPERVAKFYAEMFGKEDTEYATFEESNADFILMRGHRLWTLCPHHLLPVELVVHLAYVPNGRVLGLSKLVRVLNSVNTGPLLQEQFTRTALLFLQAALPRIKGSGILINGQHGCTKVRGVQSDARFFTYRFEGVMKDDALLQNRFFQLLEVGEGK